ncbi:MAG: hypothetical protein JWN76_305 [Chitinophagaceae bacterium]|nr:hypothetical protein [Chitinophagaceae bacterium]
MKNTTTPSRALFAVALTFLLLLPSCKKTMTTEVQPGIGYVNAQSSSAVTYEYNNLVWSDEFSGTTVNTGNWVFETGGGGWGNNEKQYYQASNATVSNGTLVITAKKQQVGSNAYTSARMKTAGKHQFTYGRIEARIKLPLGQGLWPAFWMLGANIGTVGWPQCGETDIMEHINTDNIIHGTIHWYNNGHASYSGTISSTPANYHVYTVEWDSAAIRWYVDGVKYHEANILNNINGTDEFHKPFFILLNMAVGGDWPGQTIDNTKLPASMYVDYVRVYQ